MRFAGSETYKAPKSKFSKQKSVTVTAVMEDGDVSKAEASSQVNQFDEVIAKLKELIIQVCIFYFSSLPILWFNNA